MDASLPKGKELRPQNAQEHEQPSVRKKNLERSRWIL